MLQFGLLVIPLIYARTLLSQPEEDTGIAAGKKGYDGDEPSLDGSDLSVDSSTACISHYDDISIEESIGDEASRIELCKLLGPIVPSDERLVNSERRLELPDNLHDSIVIDLPVGYHRTRRAFLTSSSTFWTDAILKHALGYDKINCTGWDRHDETIGLPDEDLPGHINVQEFIGVSRTTSYVMPARKLVGKSAATETATLLSYSEDFFAIEMKTSTPDVPFGKKFLARTQITVVNLGNNKCQMICSVQPEFPNGPPLGMKGQITKGMKSGTMETFEKIGSHIKNCAISYGWC